jgi:PmbA protein
MTRAEPAARVAPLPDHTPIARHAVELARAAGADEAEAVVETMRALSVRANGGAAETVKRSSTTGLGLRVIVDRRVGFVSTTDLRADTLADLARRAVALARHSSPDEANGVLRESLPAPEPGPLEINDPAVAELDADQLLAMAIEMERVALGYDPRIQRVDGSYAAARRGAGVLVNSYGVVRREEGASVSAFVVPLAADQGGKQRSGGYGMTMRRLADLESPERIARESARRAVAMVGARSVPAARVPVVMHPDVAGGWIAEMFGAFSGENVLLKSSWLTEKLGETIASPLVTLVDDGLLPRGVGSAPVDGEGVPSQRNVLIASGTCNMFAYDLYNARRAGTHSTGNASRSYASVPGISYRNLFLQRGPFTAEAILRSVERGFYMTDQGSFGYNDVTGDYSYQAAGFWLEGGQIAFPVDGITVAGNSLEMLRAVEMVGDDLKFEGDVASPHLKIAEMTVGG